MNQSGSDDRGPDEILAERLVDEAMKGMAVPESLRHLIRASLIGELLTTPHGRQQLRRAAPDPVVSSSGDVAKPGAPRKKAAASEASGTRRGKRGGGRS